MNEDFAGKKTQLDKWDYGIAVSGGILTAAMDIFWIGDISLLEAHSKGADITENFVKKIAAKKGYCGNSLSGAVKYLEDKYPIAADKATNDFGGGVQHHLRDFSHHPTIIGMIFSIMTQFTGCGYGTDVNGNFISVRISDHEEIGKNIVEKIYNGIVVWFFHMISDMAGSSSTVMKGREGTGLPGPLLSFLKEIASLPVIKNIAGKDEKEHYRFSKTCSKLFNGTLLGAHDENGNIVKNGELKFDLRTEIGITSEIMKNKQYLPILLNEVIVRSFYSIRRFVDEIKSKDVTCIDDIKQIEVKKFLPFNNKVLKHMLTISSVTFSVVDISAAGIKAAAKNKDNKAEFALDFMQGINYCGIGRMMVSVTGEAVSCIENLYSKFINLIQIEKNKMSSIQMNDDVLKSLKCMNQSTKVIAGKSGMYGWVSVAIEVYEQIDTAIKEWQYAHQERLHIEAVCEEHITVLKMYRNEMDIVVSEYMDEYLQAFETAFNEMEAAVLENDSDRFILGSNMIQKQLGRESQFTSQSEFDDIMETEEVFKL